MRCVEETATEELIGNAHHLPYSKELLLCLNNRILDCLENMADIDPKNKQWAQRIVNMKQDVAAYMKYYNLERLHTSNEDMSPIEYEDQFRKVSGWT